MGHCQPHLFSVVVVCWIGAQPSRCDWTRRQEWASTEYSRVLRVRGTAATQSCSLGGYECAGPCHRSNNSTAEKLSDRTQALRLVSQAACNKAVFHRRRRQIRSGNGQKGTIPTPAGSAPRSQAAREIRV